MTPTNPIKRKNRKQKMADYTIGSGDTFKDLGFPNPDEELARIKLASKVNRLIADWLVWDNRLIGLTKSVKASGQSRASG